MTPAEIIAALTAELSQVKDQLAAAEVAYDTLKVAFDSTKAERDKLFADSADAVSALAALEAQILPTLRSAKDSAAAFFAKLTGHVNELPVKPA